MTDHVPARRKSRSPLRTSRPASWRGPAQDEPDATSGSDLPEQDTSPSAEYRELLYRCPEPLWIQCDEVLCFVNTAALQFFGAPDDAALLGVHWHRLVAPEDWTRASTLITPGTSGIALTWEPVSLLGLDGGLLAADIAVTDARLDGRAAKLVVLRDARERLRLEQGLRQQRARLEQQLMERTADLHQALADVRLADRTKDAFLAKVSQELRTPLGGMIGLLEMALGQCGDAPLRESLQRMSLAGRHLSRVIDDLLDFSRIASGRLEVEAVPFSLRERLQQIREGVAHKADAKGLALLVRVDDEVPDQLIGDPLRIGQIVANLLDNAIKFTSGGRVEVHAAVATRGDTDLRLAIDVQDSGIGLTTEESAGLFQPFAGDPGRRQGSTGLGLALSQRLAEAMGGRITVRSRKGEGSCFTVALRLRLAAPPAVKNGDSGPDYSRIRVLVVEDDPLCAEIVVEQLQPLGIHPQLAENGHDAIRILSQEGPRGFDLILMDIQMPVLDGYSASRVIRSWKDYAEVPIVAMTAHSLADDTRLAAAAGMSDHLAKPFDHAALYAMLDKWLPRTSVAAASPGTVTPDPAPAAAPAIPLPPPSAASDTASGGRLPLTTLSCLDAAAGLSRFAGNIERYRHWLGRFVATGMSIAPEVRTALAAGDRTRAAEAVHGFKGNVGTLGFDGLRARAEALERAIRQDQSAVPELRLLERAVDEARREVAAALGISTDAL